MRDFSQLALLNLLLLLFFGEPSVSVPTNPDGHIITSSMAFRFNSSIPAGLSTEPVFPQQFFVPESWVTIHADSQVVPSWNEYLYDKDHPGMVRILIHPLDKHTPIIIAKTLQKYQLPQESTQFHVPLRLTESRSLYPSQLKPGQIPVSPRLSITDGFGKWHGKETDVNIFTTNEDIITTLTKLISGAQATFALFASRIIQEKLKGTKGQYFEIQPDRMVLTVKSPDGALDLGETFRDISSSVRGGEYLVPGFINQDARGALLLALANGKSSSYEYIRDIEAPIRGRALAEFFALTGFVHSSPHSQNFLVTTNEFFQATGTLKIRDLPDLIPTFDSRQTDPAMAQLFEKFEDAREALRSKIDGGESYFAFRHSFIKGSNNPDTLDNYQMTEVEKIVSYSFIKTLSEISGVSVEAIQSIAKADFGDIVSNYGWTAFDRKTEVWQQVIAGIENYRKNPFHLSGVAMAPNKMIRSGEKWRRDLSALVRDRLKGKMPSSEAVTSLINTWSSFLSSRPNSLDLEFLESGMVALDIIPEGQALQLYLNLKNLNQQKVFLNSLLDRNSTHKLVEFLRSVETTYQGQSHNVDYFIKADIKSYIQRILLQFPGRSPEKMSLELYEALYFAESAISDPKYFIGNSTQFSHWSKTIGTPERVSNLLKASLRVKGTFAEILIPFVKEMIRLTKRTCSSLFKKTL